MMMMLRTLIAVFALATPAVAEKIPLSDISRYLNGLGTAEAGFRQVNADGTTSSGKLFIKRPGRARFEYAAPDKSLVLAGSGTVAVFDDRSNEAPEQYPLRRTPLNLILARKVDLGRAKMVIGHGEAGDTTRVLAQDPDNPEYGTIELVFSANPVTLRSWIITDESGAETTVTLDDLTPVADLPAALFDIGAEADRRGL